MTTGLQLLFPPPCRDKGRRYVVTGCSFCLYLVLVLVVVGRNENSRPTLSHVVIVTLEL